MSADAYANADADANVETEAELRSMPAVEAARRLQRRHPGSAPLGGVDAGREALRLRPALHLAFPTREVEAVRELDDGRDEVVLALPALYGPGSPLPAYLTERLLGQDGESSRGLIDILNHRLLSLTLGVAGRHELESVDERAARLAGYAGLGTRCERLRWAGLLRRPRAAADLEALLADLCTPLPVGLVQNIAVDAILPPETRAHLGCCDHRLGLDTVIGDSIRTRATAFRIRLGPLSADAASDFAPGRPGHAAISEAVAWFNSDHLDWEIELLIEGGSVPAACLGAAARLGHASRLSGEPPGVYPVLVAAV